MDSPHASSRSGDSESRSSFAPSLLPPHEAAHLLFLDGVRGFAAAYVLLHHAVIHRAALAPGLETFLLALFRHGHYAVDSFIVLSGYCLMLPLLHGKRQLSPASFFWRRALRILPTYYIAMILSCALILGALGERTGTHWDVSLPVTSRDLLLHTLLLHDWFHTSSAKINHAFWSVAVEWKIYFLFPLLLIARRRWGIWTATGIALLGGYSLWLALRALQIGNTWPWGSSPYYVGLFALGMLAAEIAESAQIRGRDLRRVTLLSVGVLTLVCTVLTCAKLPDGRETPLQLRSLPVGAWTASLLVLLRIQGSAPLTRLFSSAPLTYLGKIGYTLYLVHAPVIQLVWLHGVAPLHLAAPWQTLLLLAESFSASLLVSIPFYWFAERPFHALSRRRWAPAVAVEPSEAPVS